MHSMKQKDEGALVIFDEEIKKLEDDLGEITAKLLVKVKKKHVMEKAQKEANVIHDKNSED